MNHEFLDSLFSREVSGGANWSVPCWSVSGLSPNNLPMYITDDYEDDTRYSLIDRDWNEEREESIVELFSSDNAHDVVTFYKLQKLGLIYEKIVGYNILSDDPGITVDNLLRMMKEYDEAAGGTVQPFKNAGVKY